MEPNVGRVGPVPIVGKLEVCPYDDSHTHPAERMQLHIAKCAKQNAHKKVVRCRFNASHAVSCKKLAEHEKNCSDKASVEVFVAGTGKGVVSEALMPEPCASDAGSEWCNEGWGTTSKPVLAAVRENLDASKLRPMTHVGLSKAKRKEIRERNAQEHLIARLERGDEVDPAALKCYEHRLPVPEHLIPRMTTPVAEQPSIAIQQKVEKMDDPEKISNGVTEVEVLLEKLFSASKAGRSESAISQPLPQSPVSVSPNHLRPRGRGRGVCMGYVEEYSTLGASK